MHTLLLRLPDDLHEFARLAAAADGRSLHNWIVRQIRDRVLWAAHRGDPALRAALDAAAGIVAAESIGPVRPAGRARRRRSPGA